MIDMPIIDFTNNSSPDITGENLKAMQINAKNAINSIQVGARNLIKNSNNINLNAGTSTNIVAREVGKLIVQSNNSWTCYNSNLISYFTKDISELIPEIGKEYTFSIEIKTTNLTQEGLQAAFRLFKATATNESIQEIRANILPNKNGIWQKVSGTLKIQYTNSTAGMLLMTSNGQQGFNGVIIEYRNFKVEEGNKATDWTPAPEDLMQIVTTGTEVATSEFIDGKQVYRKRYSLTDFPNNTARSYSADFSNITIQYVQGMAINTSNNHQRPIPSKNIDFKREGASIVIVTALDMTGYTGWVDVFYTKN